MMFDYYVFSEGSCKNVEENGKITGFRLKTRITYYRGIPLSMVLDINVKVDGKPVDKKKIKFSPNDGEDWFTLKEMATVTTYKWEFGKEGIIFVGMDGGLPEGEHDIYVSTSVGAAYIPVPVMGERTRKIKI